MARDSVAFSLLNALSETGFQASVIATYCCYFPFYEEVVLRRLLSAGCTNNILMVDATLCAEAFSRDDTRPRRAGLDYTLVPVRLRGAFHPKLIVALGKSKGTLFVGSHNLTLAGFGLNDEVTNEFRADGADGRYGSGSIRAALDYLQGFVPTGIASIGEVFGAVRRNVPWLEATEAVEPGGRVLLTTRGDDADLWGRIRPLVPKRPTMAFVCGPFFDNDLEFLRRLLNDVRPDKLYVGIDPESVVIDPVAVEKLHGVQFVSIGGIPRVPNRRDSGTKYLHAKVLWFIGSDGELLVTGSANPSKAAFLSESEWRNAEAVAVDRREGAGKALGLHDLITAPPVAASGWTRISERQFERPEVSHDSHYHVVLAVPSDNGFVVDQPIGTGIVFHAYAADGSVIGNAVTSIDDSLAFEASEEVRNGAHTLRGLGSEGRHFLVLVHRPDEIDKNLGGDRHRELRRALGALEEDPAQIDMLLKLTEKVIFDSDGIVRSEPTSLSQKVRTSGDETPDRGPESLAVDAVGRRSGRKNKRLASGDVLVLLDALIHKLGKGLPTPASSRPPVDEVLPTTEDDRGDDEPPRQDPDYKILAKACRGKVRRLIRRMERQFEAARNAAATPAVVQLAAVLSVVYSLRRIEQRKEWRSRCLRLVDPDDERRLLEAGGLALGWASASLGPRAIAENNGESFEELSLATGLLVWLAWEIELDAKVFLEDIDSVDLENGDNPWYVIQGFASVAAHLADDVVARDILTDAVSQTGKRGIDGRSWVTRHLHLGDRLAAIKKWPESIEKSERMPRAGDLVVLGPQRDPRIRVVLEVIPSRESDKLTVLDHGEAGRTTKFLANRVSCVGWTRKEIHPGRPDTAQALHRS